MNDASEPDFERIISGIAETLDRQSETKQVGDARLAMAIQLIRLGRQPLDAVKEAKVLVIELFAPVVQDIESQEIRGDHTPYVHPTRGQRQ